MSDHPFQRFINLVNFDQKIQSFENEKITLAAEIAAQKEQEKELARDLDDMRMRVFQLKKKVDEQELEMKVLDEKEKERKQRLENISDYKEYQAIKSEVEAIQRVQVEQEKVVLDAWNQLENSQNTLQKKTIEITQRLQQSEKKLHELESSLERLTTEAANLLVDRSEMEVGVPAEWLEKYTMMRARVVDPVVEIYHQSCIACSQMITSQEMVRAKHGALVQCQKCYRLLYLPEIMEKHAS
jgi:predicted  nucleic acid-binding Zn-ribbon protein